MAENEKKKESINLKNCRPGAILELRDGNTCEYTRYSRNVRPNRHHVIKYHSNNRTGWVSDDGRQRPKGDDHHLDIVKLLSNPEAPPKKPKKLKAPKTYIIDTAIIDNPVTCDYKEGDLVCPSDANGELLSREPHRFLYRLTNGGLYVIETDNGTKVLKAEYIQPYKGKEAYYKSVPEMIASLYAVGYTHCNLGVMNNDTKHVVQWCELSGEGKRVDDAVLPSLHPTLYEMK